MKKISTAAILTLLFIPFPAFPVKQKNSNLKEANQSAAMLFCLSNNISMKMITKTQLRGRHLNKPRTQSSRAWGDIHCNRCDYIPFSQKKVHAISNLKRHYRQTHFICTECKKEYSTQQEMRNCFQTHPRKKKKTALYAAFFNTL